ncbi:MAG: hypothetical protein QHD01_06030 [Bradyrhizobium sp.]|uniref:hypothetical protein n=1 Tax=Bradyrhizobium sp. TaxID=376 RepID=UPI0029AF5EAF|nr:hypothetical protein [Bradyrhizobium sp.]MDX3966144.1 hypothetical protein [Bradyrhizobium sp.]
MPAIKTIADFRAAYRKGRFAWPGGYPLFFVTADGAAISFKGARRERRNILEAIRDNDSRSGFRVCAVDVNWEDSDLRCDVTGERIESAYAEESES